MRNIKNKRSLYESIMKNISKTVKRKLNEDDKNFNINDYDEDEIYTGETTHELKTHGLRGLRKYPCSCLHTL